MTWGTPNTIFWGGNTPICGLELGRLRAKSPTSSRCAPHIFNGLKDWRPQIWAQKGKSVLFEARYPFSVGEIRLFVLSFFCGGSSKERHGLCSWGGWESTPKFVQAGREKTRRPRPTARLRDQGLHRHEPHLLHQPGVLRRSVDAALPEAFHLILGGRPGTWIRT